MYGQTVVKAGGPGYSNPDLIDKLPALAAEAKTKAGRYSPRFNAFIPVKIVASDRIKTSVFDPNPIPKPD